MKGSWKTTVLGILALLGAAVQIGTSLLDSDPNTVPDVAAFGAAAAGIGLMFARDNGVTSESAGAK